MNRTSARVAALGALLLVTIGCAAPPPAAEPAGSVTAGWEQLEPGLSLGTFMLETPAGKPATARVLRIDPERFELRLFNASATRKSVPHTARDWCRSGGALACVNAGMYQQDLLTSVSLMRSREHVNNGHLTRHRSVLAFDRLDPQAPRVKLIDLECEDFADWKDRYGSMLQSIRMLSCDGDNVWEQQPDRWSIASVGTDRIGNVLFIHVRHHFTVHDLINALRALPVDLERMMYAEGGPEAQLWVGTGEREYEFVGTYDPLLRDTGNGAWPIPNVLAVQRREVASD